MYNWNVILKCRNPHILFLRKNDVFRKFLRRTHVIEIESFINIHKVYRENRKVLNKRWLDESLTRQKNLLSEINLKRMGPEVYEKIQKTEKLTFLKSLDSIH